jgi:protocatechuate 3,4-dioxygenase beta subunit
MAEHSYFSRRRFVAGGLGVASAVQLRSAAAAAGFGRMAEVCRLAAEQEVGPYYVADELLRTDIAEGKPGVPLSLRIVVLDSRTCAPLRNAAVDIWHCDALGLYSGFTKQNPMGPGGFGGPPLGRPPGPPPDGPPPHNHPTDQFTFLRGIQLTGEDGVVQFQSIFPGVYMGRTNHIHFKVRVGGHEGGKTYQAGHAAHTGQIFFPEELAVQLMEREPYRRHEIHRTTQAEDMVYGDQQGELSVARIDPVKVKELAADLKIRAELIAAVDPTATPADARRRGGPGR